MGRGRQCVSSSRVRQAGREPQRRRRRCWNETICNLFAKRAKVEAAAKGVAREMAMAMWRNCASLLWSRAHSTHTYAHTHTLCEHASFCPPSLGDALKTILKFSFEIYLKLFSLLLRTLHEVFTVCVFVCVQLISLLLIVRTIFMYIVCYRSINYEPQILIRKIISCLAS